MKKLLVKFVTIILIFTCLMVPVNAYSTTTTDTITISPSKNDFKNAKSPKYSSTSHVISDSIAYSYEMDIVHYEAPKSGYYSIYTTGTTDTVGKVFEEQNVLFWTTEYLDHGLNDDSGIGLNYRHVLKLDKYEDYYICTRAYGSQTGEYNLVIKPNDDARTSNIGGHWVNDTADVGSLLTGGGYQVLSKTYLTVDQVKVYYQMLRNDVTKALIKNSYVRNGVVGTINELANYGFNTLNLFVIIDSFSPEPIISSTASFLVTLTEGVANAIFDSFYENTDSISDILAALETYGGAGYNVNYAENRDEYYASHGVCIQYRALAINYNTDFSNVYYTYDSAELVGKDYEKGHWE